MMSFIQYLIWNPIKYSIKQCLNKPVEEISFTLNDFILKVVLNQVYIPYLGMQCLLNPEDSQLKEVHWNLKVIFGSSNIFTGCLKQIICNFEVKNTLNNISKEIIDQNFFFYLDRGDNT